MSGHGHCQISQGSTAPLNAGEIIPINDAHTSKKMNARFSRRDAVPDNHGENQLKAVVTRLHFL
jgi:hypothetical protein